MEAEVEINGTSFLAQLTGLSPVTTYEYQVAEGESAYAIYTFTTEGAQLPNNSFERWSGSTPLLVHAADEDRFWDTGNEGAATLGGNVTVYDETLFASGNRSIKMQSQFVGVGIFGKFAAGNVFAGKYLKTDGTDGILGFGREFSDRPVKMRGYIKYNSGIVDYASNTEYHELIKGDPDQGSVYIAVGDWAGENYNGETWPYIIKTKSSERQLFDADVEGTIAYGEKTLYESTPGEGMIPFEIELDYRTWDRKPTAIVIVASASKYGDYFTGSSESCMWLDDLELVYE
ncbi:MAG: PCMD domain-containing protein [Bacteroides sp.]|nr:PCMD domain-containing protein [Bacteroides sp.]